MFARNYRLHEKEDLAEVFKKGKFSKENFLCLKYFRTGRKFSRLVVLVSTSFSKKAVERNRAKRFLREKIRPFLEKIDPGFDIAIYLKGVKPEEIEKTDLTKMIERLLLKARLLKNKN